MTFVRGSKARTERQTVITDKEMQDALAKAETLKNPYFILRAKAVLSLFRLTGKRRGEVAMVPLENFKQQGEFLNVTFILEKKRKGSILQKLSTKSLPLMDTLTQNVTTYLAFLREKCPTAKYWLPSGKSVFGNYMIIPSKHLTGREIHNIVRACTDTFWCHLNRETVASDIIKQDNSIIAAFKVQRRLDLESYTTGFNYLRRFASDIIEREGVNLETAN